MLDLVSKGVPVETAYGAAGMTRSEYRTWRSVQDNADRVDIARKKAEAKFFMDMVATGRGDWKCMSQVLERINPEQYAKPEVQAQLRQTDNDAKQIAMNIMKFIAIAEDLHSGDSEVVKDAVVAGGDAVPEMPKIVNDDVDHTNPYDEGT